MAEEILATLSGVIVKISMEVGATVKEDDEVAVIEAMKMKTPMYPPRDGVVKEIRVKVGDFVEEDDVIAVIE